MTLNCRWQQSLTIEVILSAAFGIESESQTNPDDKVTQYARDAMNPKPYANIALMIPVVGKKIVKSIALTSWGFNWAPMISVAKTIINGRKNSLNKARVVSFTIPIKVKFSNFPL